MSTSSGSLLIGRLPVEVFGSIFDVAESLKDMVNLACTCKTLASLTDPAMRRHRVAYRDYRYASDRNPSTVVALVRHLVLRSDPVVAKYTRSLDIWGARLSWDEWKRFEIDSHGVKLVGDNVFVDRFSPSEIERLLAITRGLVGEHELENAREELENGGDGLLKLLIIASAPRLESLKFIRRRDLLHKSCQAWLYKAISHQIVVEESSPLSESQWPPGLKSLEKLAVGVDAGIPDDNIDVVESELRADWEGQAELCVMMMLPAVTSLYYDTSTFPDRDDWDTDLAAGGDEAAADEASHHGLQPGTPQESSKIAHLYLDCVCGEYTTINPIFARLLAMPWGLESLGLRWTDGEYDPAEIMGALAQYQPHSLKKMMFYNPGSMVGYRCAAYRPEDVPDAPLTMWWQCTEDIELQALYDQEGEEVTREAVVNTFLKYLDRKHAEVIILDGGLSGDHLDDKAKRWAYYEAGLLALIKSAGRKNLKALFIDFPHEPDSDGDLHSPDGFAKVVRLAGEMGIDLYGSKHIKAKKRHALDFPMAPTKWDIATGPDFGRRVERGFTGYDCVGDNWRKPSRDKYAWHYTSPQDGS